MHIMMLEHIMVLIICSKVLWFITPFSLKNGTLFNKKNIIAPFQAW